MRTNPSLRHCIKLFSISGFPLACALYRPLFIDYIFPENAVRRRLSYPQSIIVNRDLLARRHNSLYARGTAIGCLCQPDKINRHASIVNL